MTIINNNSCKYIPGECMYLCIYTIHRLYVHILYESIMITHSLIHSFTACPKPEKPAGLTSSRSALDCRRYATK